MKTTYNVSLDNVQKELTNLRNHCQKGEQEKACLFNVIIYTHDLQRTAYYKDLAEQVMQQFPCHIIFIQGNRQQTKNELKINVSIEKRNNSDEISGDQIFIEVSGEDYERIPFLITSYLVPDLPVHLVWGQDIIQEDLLLVRLQQFASRLIIDSDATQDLQQFSQHILVDLNRLNIPIVDMNWTRIEGWREVIAQTFDTSQRLEQLKNAHTLQLTYQLTSDQSSLKPETQAIYLQGWLAICLGWQFQRLEKTEQGLIIHYQSSFSPVSIHLLSKTDSEYTSGEIVEVSVKGIDEYECHLKRQGVDQVEVQSCNQYECKLPLHLVMTTLQSGRNFIQEIFYQQVSEHYFYLLQLLSLEQESSNGKI